MKKTNIYLSLFIAFNLFIVSAKCASSLIEDPTIYKITSEFLYPESAHTKKKAKINHYSHDDKALGVDTREGAKNYGRLKAALAHKNGKQALEESFQDQIDIRSLNVGLIAPGTANVSDQYMDQLAALHPKLTRLDFSDCGEISDETLIRWIARFPNLTSISTNNCYNITNRAIIYLAEHCPGLQEVTLLDSYRITDAAIISLAEHCPGLREFKLSTTIISGAAIISLAEHCHGLQIVDLYNNRRITNATITSLAEHCPSLRQINLESTNITDAAIISLAEHCPGLQVVELNGNRRITDAAIIYLAKHCPGLQKVNVYYDDNISRAVKNDLVQKGIRVR